MQNQHIKTIIIDIAPHGLSSEELSHRMDELESLVSTYGGVTIVKRVQKRTTPDYRTFVGSGKLDEIIAVGDELGAELLIIGNIMKPAQVWNVNEHLRLAKSKMQAWDRVDLILKIFALHAVSPESKLQIELAAIKHMGPRIFGMGMELSRQGGGSKNAKGQGETNTEIMKRHLRDKELALYEKLKTYERTRGLHRDRRKRKGLPTVGIVGYTNAGKSTLMNALTHKGVFAEDKLFATLGTSVGKMWLPHPSPLLKERASEIPPPFSEGEGNEGGGALEGWGEGLGLQILINDTIGFIRDLPPDLIAAFTSTLEDSLESDLLLHVIDASDPWCEEKIKIVDDTLDHIGAKQKRIYVMNKSDKVPESAQEMNKSLKEKYRAVTVSAHTLDGLSELKEKIRDELSVEV